ncbi:hypothetical protein EB22_01949 [Enterococcus faecium]|nr:hypothetical protein OGC_04031 [Enterococcus faecium EnGen0010]ELA60317.1 hypothetical protein OGE_03846 [Enterococcus faecium EnGen0022]EOG40077.1 hypothetical protein SMS_00048 [Enterococcus faecium EnGen0184]EOM71515.1 hypothetical protein SKE_00048 [Enterococcus faecium EnGen0165]RBS45646.1 hypothetical protein EB22_01949 [Enterococcus faecium]
MESFVSLNLTNNIMKNFDTYYVIVFSISLLLILLTLMQYKEYPEYFILTFVYLVSSYTLLYKFRSSSRVSKVCFLISLLIL